MKKLGRPRRCGAAKSRNLPVLGVGYEVVEEQRTAEWPLARSTVRMMSLVQSWLPKRSITGTSQWSSLTWMRRARDVDRAAGIVDDADVVDHPEVVAAKGV